MEGDMGGDMEGNMEGGDMVPVENWEENMDWKY